MRRAERIFMASCTVTAYPLWVFYPIIVTKPIIESKDIPVFLFNMLTLYYASATFLQSWRIKKVCTKISEQLAQQMSISFYTLNSEKGDDFDIGLATSELCNNRSIAKVSEILWLKGNHRGCCLQPVQSLQIMPWITFPEAPSWIPFGYELNAENLLHQLKRQDNLLHLLVETDIQPSLETTIYAENVKIEEYGRLIAWKIDSNLALLIETDIEHFTKLLIATFLQNNCRINDFLPIIRIESVQYEGKPQPFTLVASHLRKSTRTKAHLNVEEWQKHLENLRALSVLANQATEFEYNKNRTEGKTGVIKPDLIAHETKPTTDEVDSVPQSQTDTINAPPSESIETELKEDILKPSTAPSQATSPQQRSTLKGLKAKPTEIKRPGSNAKDNRFKTSKVDESPPKQESKPIEDEKNNESPQKSKSSKGDELEEISSTTTIPEDTLKISKPIATPNVGDVNALVSNQNTAKLTSAAGDGNVSAIRDNAKRPSLRRNKDSLSDSKPLNILIYSESATVRDNTIETLRKILEKDVYTIYPMSVEQAEQKHWFNNSALLLVCGTVPANLGEIFVNYFLNGGKVVSICSDILHFLLPNYRTTEVREHELVQFSYDKWQKVKMMHHIFCYQPSPVRKNFSTDSDDSAQASAKKPALVCPRSIELKDLHGNIHNLDVQVLGTEETWNTPSILLAANSKSGGRAVFSQVHLEINPTEFEGDENMFTILKQNETIRLEIFADLLNKYLNILVAQKSNSEKGENKKCVYQNAYFLGHHESKFELLEKLKEKSDNGYIIPTSKLTLHFCGRDDRPPHANTNVLPILIHSCPDDFSTVEYFDNLKTKDIGRLVIYAPIVSSSMNVINELELVHGLAVLAREQTEGIGRSNNQWLSPLGCAMFSIQLHMDIHSQLGSRLPLLQHVIGVAMSNTLRSHEQYKVLDIGLKWPNDIYSGGMKIGGLIVRTILRGNKVIANIGCAMNLQNTKPTLCLDDLIRDHNKKTNCSLPFLKYEQFVALVFNEIEKQLQNIETQGFEEFYKLYYSQWLHSDKEVEIIDKDGNHKSATVVGIDEYGFLKVKLLNGTIEVVQPDGNSFDLLQGLIVPKFN